MSHIECLQVEQSLGYFFDLIMQIFDSLVKVCKSTSLIIICLLQK